MALLGGIGRFIDKYLFGYALGTAAGPSLRPFVQTLENEAWTINQVMPVPAVAAARVVAQGEMSRADGIAEAALTGFDETRFDLFVNMLDQTPDLATLYDLFRRDHIDEARFREGAQGQYIKPKYIDALVASKERLLSPAEAANAWQQGYMSDTDAAAEAKRSGINEDRSLIQREIAGLPPGAMDGLTLLRRGLVDEGIYRQIVREGHTKVKYTDALLGLRYQVLTAVQYASLWLKGWLTEAEAKRGGALTGYDADAMDLLYKDRGRPATVRQAHIGFARGGRLPGVGDDERATLRRSVEESNIRTEWFDLLYAQRYTYPSAFVLRALANDGTFTKDQTEQILLESGWKPEYATLAAERWTTKTTTVTSKWADRARSRLFTAAHDDYMDGNASADDARALLEAVGATTVEQDAIIELWNLERARTRKDLTQAQILKLYKKSIWTRDQAYAALLDIGMRDTDANALLDAG